MLGSLFRNSGSVAYPLPLQQQMQKFAVDLKEALMG